MQTECGLENPDLLNNWIEGNIKVLQSVWLHVQHLFLETSQYKVKIIALCQMDRVSRQSDYQCGAIHLQRDIVDKGQRLNFEALDRGVGDAPLGGVEAALAIFLVLDT